MAALGSSPAALNMALTRQADALPPWGAAFLGIIGLDLKDRPIGVKLWIMTTNEWLGCDLLESVPGKVSGAVVFKHTRLPVETITGSVDSFIEVDGLSLDEAIAETLQCHPSVPGGADSIREVLAYREARDHQLQS
jgi:hypothetical protein